MVAPERLVLELTIIRIRVGSVAPERHLEDDRPHLREEDLPVRTDRTSLRKLVQKLRIAEVFLEDEGAMLPAKYKCITYVS